MPNTRMREEFDGDSVTGPVPTDYRTETNKYEIQCAGCGKRYYVNTEMRDDLEHAIENDVETPFICSICQEAENDELAYR